MVAGQDMTMFDTDVFVPGETDMTELQAYRIYEMLERQLLDLICILGTMSY